ncbi:MAG: ribulose-phosphate 3-epimerase [Lachnospiraceae bacterium]|nr:ribulose-phosphate 3-epimerase [Lachnospiraceae bacterium]
MSQYYFAPSILSADFNRLGEQIAQTKEGGAQYVHIDVMDGVFVPNLTFGMPVIKSIRSETDLVFDVHLMVQTPRKLIERIALAGADIITFHIEATDDPGACIAAIHEQGKKVGLALKPSTPIEAAVPYLQRIDMLLVMTVEPGYGGQKYIAASTQRIRQARRIVDESGLDVDIEVDGGITRDTIDIVTDAGANVIVAGSAVYRGDVYENTRWFAEHLGILPEEG